jgi:hypothetical protein
MRILLLFSLLFSQSAWAADHAGNVFVAGEDVRVTVPKTWAAWRAIDIDRKDIANGSPGDGVANLGKLPVGYFEVREKDGPGLITAAVLAKTKTSDDTPIAIDMAASWFYAEPQQIRDACAIAKLAGVKWVRDRASWPELEPARSKWADETRYERAMKIQHEEGLKILQVNHISPPWAAKDPRHFPEDLRDAYNFYRGLAKRWRDLADAIEPWNEPDLEIFGGHTGCEIASFQKVAYLGLKAGDPKKPVNLAVFAIDRAETLDEFGLNKVYPYFDRYDLHHYIGLPAYSRAYARHRTVSGGRPLWTTEFNLTINWADEKTHEPSAEDLRVQGYRVAKVFSGALYQGCVKAFYFILGHYVERNLQYGIVHTDLTPRPAYVAFATVGRLLNAAEPIGRVDLGDEKLHGFVFRTIVDGAQRETLVAWSETKPTTVTFPKFERTYDYLGRELKPSKRIELTRAPIFLVAPRGWSKESKIQPPPAKPKWLDGKVCPVVLQIAGKGDFKQSAFELDGTKKLRLIAYNFGDKPAHGQLSVEGAKCDTAELTLAAGEHKELSLADVKPGVITAKLELRELGQALVVANAIQAQLKN